MLPDIDESLLLYQDKIKVAFSKRWAKHKCDKPGARFPPKSQKILYINSGCQRVLVIDRGVKVIIETTQLYIRFHALGKSQSLCRSENWC